MRPVPHSSFRTPLDDILRAPANLRVLRALGRRARSQPAICQETGLSKPSVSRAIQTLWDLGLLTKRGVGEPTAIRADHPIASALLRLFDEERQRVERVYRELRGAFGPNAIAIWIEGKVARGEDGPDDPIDVGVLVDARRLDSIRDAAEPQIARIETSAAVMLDVRYYTRADLAAMSPARRKELTAVLPLTDLAPAAFAEKRTKRRRKRIHADRDAEARARAEALVQLIASDSTLVPRALHWVREKLPHADPGEARTLREWERVLLAATPAQLRRLLTDDSERATRLRQSSPFSPILSPDERAALQALIEAA